MASLTSISISARKIIRYGVYTIILILILRFAFNISTAIFKILFPPKEPKPTVAFGKLPKLSFPNPEEHKLKGVSYTLEIATGGLPKLPNQAVVYFMPPIQSDIGVVEKAKKIAQSLGFNPDGKVLIESIPNLYVFEKANSPSKLTMNIVSGEFSISYNLNQNPAILRDMATSPESAINLVQSLLKGAGLLNQDLEKGPITHEFLRYEQGNFVPAISQSEANAVKVNLFRRGFESRGQDIPSITPTMPEANIWFLIVGRSRQIIAGEYHFFPIDNGKNATYPLKTAEEAFEELKNGEGFITNPKSVVGSSVTIRKVYLSYYDAGQYSEYYQPVVVFEGDNNFYGIIPAVKSEYYGKE